MGADYHQKRKRRSKRKFVQIFHDVIESPAYQSLSTNARAALVEVCHRFNGENNGKIVFSVREMATRLGIGQRQAGAALRQLMARGILVPTWKGRYCPGEFRRATEWRITFQLCDRQPATQDYQRWQAEQPQIQKAVSPEDTGSVPRGHTRKTGNRPTSVRNGHASEPGPVSPEDTHLECTTPTADVEDAAGPVAQPKPPLLLKPFDAPLPADWCPERPQPRCAHCRGLASPENPVKRYGWGSSHPANVLHTACMMPWIDRAGIFNGARAQ